jgi:hypothetical protein
MPFRCNSKIVVETVMLNLDCVGVGTFKDQKTTLCLVAHHETKEEF